MIGQICAAFNCTPSQAIREPLELCLDIMDERAFAAAYHEYTTASDKGKVPVTPMVQRVKDCLRERNKRRLGRQGRANGHMAEAVSRGE